MLMKPSREEVVREGMKQLETVLRVRQMAACVGSVAHCCLLGEELGPVLMSAAAGVETKKPHGTSVSVL